MINFLGTQSSTLFSKPEQTNPKATTTPQASNTFSLFNPQTQQQQSSSAATTTENQKPPSSSLFTTPNPTGNTLFGASAALEPQKEQAKPVAGSLFANLQSKPSAESISVSAAAAAINDSNKTASLFGGANNANNSNNNNNSLLNANNKTDNSSGTNTFGLFGQKSNNGNSALNEKTSSSIFSGISAQAPSQSANVFIAQPAHNKPGSIFSSALGANANNSLFSFNANSDLNNNNNNLSKIENKIEPVNSSNSIAAAGEQQQSKSLLNNNNPFLQKTSISQNNLFTSNL